MTAPYMGGFEIVGAEFLSTHTLMVRISSTYGALYHYQLYAGRTRIGETNNPSERRIVGQLIPSKWPQHITVLAVPIADQLTDFGDQLPPRPYNRVKLSFSTVGWPADSAEIDITAGTVVGGAVDANNLVERILYDVDRTYEVRTNPMPGSGQWNFKATGRDDKGNLGTASAVMSADVLAHPPDVELDSEGRRLVVAVASETATVTFTEPS